MKKINITCLLILLFVNADGQGLCKSSFGFKKTDNASFLINANLPATTSQLYSTNGFTWETWFKLNSPVINQSLLISVEDAFLYQDIFLGFGWGGTPNALSFVISDNGANNFTTSTQSLQAFTPGTWYHVAAVCDYNNAFLNLYLNGNLISTGSIPPGILNNRLSNNRQIQIGNASQNLSGLDADLDEVRFWNVPRTQAEIQSGMNSCLTIPPGGLVAYFKGDENGGIVANSSVNSAFTGSLTKVTWANQVPAVTCPFISISPVQTPACKNFSFAGINTSNATAPVWQWDFGDGALANTQNAVHGYTTSGTKLIKLIVTDGNGCKDSASVTVTVLPTSFSTISQTICQGQTYLGYNSSGVYIDTLLAANGCDSIRTLNLIVKPKSFSTINQSICQGQTFLGHNSSGVYIDTLVAANGCDSIRTLNLIVKPKSFSTINQSICQGQTFLGYNSTGTYTDTLAATNGCDSVRTLNLTVTSKLFSTINQSICQGQTFLGHNTSGVYIDTLVATTGCDSIRTLNLIVKPKSFSTINQSICQGQTFLGHNSTGTYVDTLIAANGCDSIRTLNLIVKPKSFSTINQSICQGQTFLGHNSTGTYVDTLIAANGCDSIRTLNLIAKSKSFSTINQSICQGQTFLGHNSTGTYVDTLAATNGCDSIRTVNLIVNTKLFTSTDTSICPGQSYMGHNTSGTYIDTSISASGCDSIHTLRLTVLSAIVTDTDTTVCYGKTYFGHGVSGNYTDTFSAITGCDSVRRLKLTVLPKSTLSLGTGKSICAGDSIILSPGVFNSYLWQDGSKGSTYVVKNPGTYTVTVTSNCDTITANILITEGVCSVYFPSAFSPNGDRNNDIFKVLTKLALKNYFLIVKNRLGQTVFQTTDYLTGWDGKVNGQLQNPGNYVWYSSFISLDNRSHTMKGNVLLIQ